MLEVIKQIKVMYQLVTIKVSKQLLQETLDMVQKLVEDLIKKVTVKTIQLKLTHLAIDIDLIIFMFKNYLNTLLDIYMHIIDKGIIIVKGFNPKFF